MPSRKPLGTKGPLGCTSLDHFYFMGPIFSMGPTLLKRTPAGDELGIDKPFLGFEGT